MYVLHVDYRSNELVNFKNYYVTSKIPKYNQAIDTEIFLNSFFTEYPSLNEVVGVTIEDDIDDKCFQYITITQ